MSRYFWSMLFASLLFTGPVAAQTEEKPASEISMFDGKSLSGWVGREDLWSVVDGAIVGRTTAEDPIKKNTFLIWEGEMPSDFELHLSYWVESGNSGVQYRSRVIEGAPDFVVGGYQADIEAANNYTGINYEERGRGILAQRGQRVTIAEDGSKQTETFGDAAEIAKKFHDGWNDYRIVAQGGRLQQFINGTLTCEVIDGQSDRAASDGVVALQLHVGPPMLIRFKDFKLIPLGK